MVEAGDDINRKCLHHANKTLLDHGEQHLLRSIPFSRRGQCPAPSPPPKTVWGKYIVEPRPSARWTTGRPVGKKRVGGGRLSGRHKVGLAVCRAKSYGLADVWVPTKTSCIGGHSWQAVGMDRETRPREAPPNESNSSSLPFSSLAYR